MTAEPFWLKQPPDCYCESLPEIPCPRHEPEAYAERRASS